jgi:hypothetical protein
MTMRPESRGCFLGRRRICWANGDFVGKAQRSETAITARATSKVEKPVFVRLRRPKALDAKGEALVGLLFPFD